MKLIIKYICVKSKISRIQQCTGVIGCPCVRLYWWWFKYIICPLVCGPQTCYTLSTFWRNIKTQCSIFFLMTFLELAVQNLNILVFICLFFKVSALSIFYYFLDFPFSSDCVAHKTPRLFLVSFWRDFIVDGSEGSIYNSLLFRNVRASYSFLCKGCTGVAVRSSHVKQWPTVLNDKVNNMVWFKLYFNF